MPSLNVILGTAVRAMQVSQIGLSVASNNIANAQTPGYTRQRMVVTPADELPFGNGVKFERVDAIRSTLIDARIRQETSRRSHHEELEGLLSHAQDWFNDTDSTGLAPVISKFFNSFHTLSLDPASVNFREQVRTAANDMASAFRDRHDRVSELLVQADRDVTRAVADVNRLGAAIAEITQVLSQRGGEGPAHDLRDRRTELVRQLSEIVGVHEVDSPSGFQLSLKNGHTLVTNGTFTGLRTQVPAGSTGVRVFLAANDVTDALEGGVLSARIKARDQYFPSYLADLDQLAYDITSQVNLVHRTGYTLNGTSGVDLLAPQAAVSGSARTIGVSAAVATDVRNVAASAQSTGQDNQLALQLAGLLSAPVFSGGSVMDQYGSLVYRVGSDIDTAGSKFEEHDALLNQLQSRRDDVSGVSVDEEAIQVLQFQRAFEASARMIRVVDELLQTTLGMVG